MITYMPDSLYINGDVYSKNMEIYSGYVEITKSNGDLLSKLYYKNGNPDFSTYESKISKRGRVDCNEIFYFEWTEASSQYGTHVSETTLTSEIHCFAVDDEPETIDAGPSSGGGGSCSGSNSGPTPIGGGNSGVLEPIDIAYYLEPAEEKNSIDNPYDGMQARDSNGVIYTYDAELGAWLLPELENLLENENFEIVWKNDKKPDFEKPEFNTAILTAIAIPALAEPTPVGEVVLGGATVVVGVIFVYQLADYTIRSHLRNKENVRDHCRRLFELCTGKYAQKNMLCSTCQQFCIAQEYWDFLNCPLK